MKARSPKQPIFLTVLLFVLATLGNDGWGTEIWTSKTNGLWRGATNWSLGRPPDIGTGAGTTFITNAISKTVTLDGSTLDTNLVINALTIGAPANATNLLLLQDLGTNRPLTIINGGELRLNSRGALVITNSSLILTGSFGNGFNVFAGTVTLDSGLLRMIEEPGNTNTTVATIGRTNLGTLLINGGLMDVGLMNVAEYPSGSIRPRGLVRINGGKLNVSGELSIGSSALSTGAVEVAGGTLQVRLQGTDIMRVGDVANGQMIVSNGMVTVGDVSIGRHANATGLLTVYTNGFFGGADDLNIGRFPGATGSVVVAGGTIVVTNHPIWVGREGVGQFSLSNGFVQAAAFHVVIVDTNKSRGLANFIGGNALITSNLSIGSPKFSTGQVFVTGSTIDVTNQAQLAFVAVDSGTLNIGGGSLTADRLILTNQAGKLAMTSGLLRVKETVVSNGVPFQVGDGTNAATLFLLGGTHRFANGLIIAKNATLAGCGTIIGSITNLGTNALNCGPLITAQPQSRSAPLGSNVLISAAASGSMPLTYQWFFHDALINGAASPTLLITNAQLSDAGDYLLVVTNSFGSTTSVVARLRVLMRPSISQVTRSDATAAISFGTVSGLTYFIEFKDTLSAPSWTPVLPGFPAEGTTLIFQDTNATVPTRFYRIRAE